MDANSSLWLSSTKFKTPPWDCKVSLGICVRLSNPPFFKSTRAVYLNQDCDSCFRFEAFYKLSQDRSGVHWGLGWTQYSTMYLVCVNLTGAQTTWPAYKRPFVTMLLLRFSRGNTTSVWCFYIFFSFWAYEKSKTERNKCHALFR